jgi:hypothetical protein
MANWIASLFATALEAIPGSKNSGQNALGAVVRSIVRAPLKAIGAFLFAPFLIFRIARHAADPKRKWLAALGLFIGAVLSIAAGTFLGTLAGAVLAGSLFGFWVGFGFLVGTSLSVVLTVTFQVLILNATCFLFLGLSSAEVVEYLKNTSE